MELIMRATNPNLLAALREAGQRKASTEQVNKQRVSFIVGSLKPNTPITREKIESVLAEQEGRSVQ